jgi:hypothetical protein
VDVDNGEVSLTLEPLEPSRARFLPQRQMLLPRWVVSSMRPIHDRDRDLRVVVQHTQHQSTRHDTTRRRRSSSDDFSVDPRPASGSHSEKRECGELACSWRHSRSRHMHSDHRSTLLQTHHQRENAGAVLLELLRHVHAGTAGPLLPSASALCALHVADDVLGWTEAHLPIVHHWPVDYDLFFSLFHHRTSLRRALSAATSASSQESPTAEAGPLVTWVDDLWSLLLEWQFGDRNGGLRHGDRRSAEEGVVDDGEVVTGSDGVRVRATSEDTQPSRAIGDDQLTQDEDIHGAAAVTLPQPPRQPTEVAQLLAELPGEQFCLQGNGSPD